MGILSFLAGCSGIGPKGSNGIGKRAKDNQSGVSEFYYSYNGSIGGNSYSYRIKDEDGKKVFIYEAMEHREFEDMKLDCPPEILDRLYKLYLDMRIAEWDGFEKYNPKVLDGDGFSLRIRFNDGTKMSASGSNACPDNYGEFEDRMSEILDPLAEEILDIKRNELISKGLDGHLTSLLFIFKQQGTSGSDEYHVLLRSEKNSEKNLEVEIKANGEKLKDYYRSPISESNLDELEQAIKDYEIIKWYDFYAHTEDPNNSEWFQISFNFDNKMHISAHGTKKPEHYEEFRAVCINWLNELVNKCKQDKTE